MYNRHVFERDKNSVDTEKDVTTQLQKLKNKHRRANEELSHHYKARINDFLVQMANQPLKLGQYQPPIKHITRSVQETKLLSSAQLYINGFKTNRQRVERVVSMQKILDLSPATINNSPSKYRPRQVQRQIQPGMRFANANSNEQPSKLRSKSMVTLPKLSPKRMHFKAMEQFGNRLKSMEQDQLELASLVNRLQTIAGPSQINPSVLSMETLKKCNINKPKHAYTVTSTTH